MVQITDAETVVKKPSITTANCDNTTTETAVMTVVIPEGTWLNGEEVTASLISKHKQGAGSSRTLTIKIKLNGSSETLLSGSSITSSAQEGNSRRTFGFTRIGSEVWCYLNAINHGDLGGTTAVGAAGVGTISYGTSSTVGKIWTAVDFTSDITITYTIQWGAAANANTYWRPVSATCFKK